MWGFSSLAAVDGCFQFSNFPSFSRFPTSLTHRREKTSKTFCTRGRSRRTLSKTRVQKGCPSPFKKATIIQNGPGQRAQEKRSSAIYVNHPCRKTAKPRMRTNQPRNEMVLSGDRRVSCSATNSPSYPAPS